MLKRVLKPTYVQVDDGQKWTRNQVYHKTSLRVSQNPTTVQLKTKKWQIYMKSRTSPTERRRILYIIFIFTRYIHIVYKNVDIDSYLWCKSSKGNFECTNFNTTNLTALNRTDGKNAYINKIVEKGRKRRRRRQTPLNQHKVAVSHRKSEQIVKNTSSSCKDRNRETEKINFSLWTDRLCNFPFIVTPKGAKQKGGGA